MLVAFALALFAEHTAPVSTPSPPVTKSVIRLPKLARSAGSFLTVPRGFRANLFAGGLTHPRMMAVAPNGDVFVVETRIEVPGPQPHRVIVLRDQDGDGSADERSLWSDDLDMPFGIRFAYGHLYVANTGSVVRWPYSTGATKAPGKPQSVLDGIPQNGYRNHWTRNILFSPSFDALYLTVGSEQNVAVEGPRRAVIERYAVRTDGTLDQGSKEIYASGMRNPIGLDFNPATGELWANVAERDYLGDDLVPDFTTGVKPGGFYGWPYYYLGTHRDVRVPQNPSLRDKVVLPDFNHPAHATPIDIKFNMSSSFPAEYAHDAFVALHGSQNRSKMNGYKVVRLRFDADGRFRGVCEDFVTGWLPKGSNKKVYGRPAGLAFLPDGSLLITDDWGGRIWRVAYAAP